MFDTTHLIKRYVLASGFLLCFPLGAQANYYLNLEAGQALSKIDTGHFQSFNQSIISKGGSAALSKKDSSQLFLLGFGYHYSANMAFELNYLNIGKVSAKSKTSDISTTGITRNREIEESLKQSGIALSVAGKYTLNSTWAVKGITGLVWLTQKSKGSATGESLSAAGTVLENESEQFKQTDNEFAPLIGLSTTYQVSHNQQIHLSWRRIVNINPNVLGEQSPDLITAGLHFSF